MAAASRAWVGTLGPRGCRGSRAPGGKEPPRASARWHVQPTFLVCLAGHGDSRTGRQEDPPRVFWLADCEVQASWRESDEYPNVIRYFAPRPAVLCTHRHELCAATLQEVSPVPPFAAPARLDPACFFCCSLLLSA